MTFYKQRVIPKTSTLGDHFLFTIRDLTPHPLLCLYLNTTWGILTILANRQETEGPWICLKMTQWRLVPVLNVAQLDTKDVKRLAAIFDEFSHRLLSRIPQQYGLQGNIDEIRRELDTAFLEAMAFSFKGEDLLALYKEIGASLKYWIGV